jgi:hypothetical protein
MAADMSSYYFNNMYTVIQNFVACCYACFLSYKGKKTKLGVYPTPSYPFQEIMLDLAENLNNSGGYSHLLILTCLLTDFTIIVPLKGKTNSEISNALLASVFQQFPVAKIHSDNGPGFRANGWLETMASLGIQVIATSALHPEGRGTIEKRVGIIKILMPKMLAIRKDLNWEYIPYLIAAILNNSVSGKTGFKPTSMVFGTTGEGPQFMNLEKVTPPHIFVKNNQMHIAKITQEKNEMLKIATEHIIQNKVIDNERANRNRRDSHLNPGDFVFVLDRTVIVGHLAL